MAEQELKPESKLPTLAANPGEVIIFVGSGISLAHPTAWPNWHELTTNILDSAKNNKLIPNELFIWCQVLLSKGSYYQVFDQLFQNMPLSEYNRIVQDLMPHRAVPNIV